jgi:hypothetical protein
MTYICIMIYKGNKKYDDFIANLKDNHFYGNNKRIFKILTDDDMNELDHKTLTFHQKKLAEEHDQLILSIINLIDGDYRMLINKSDPLTYIEVNSHIDKRLLQIAKIRMVIIPEFLVNTTTHSVSNHEYAVLRALWLDNDFRKIKKFSISLGNTETLEMSGIIRERSGKKRIDSPELIVAKQNLTKKLLDLYREEYS